MNRRLALSRRALLGASAAALVPWPGLAQANAEPIRGGRIVASMDLQPRSLDPIMGDAPTSDRYVLIQMFESLVRFDEKGELVPWLAESWEYGDGGASILFRLRRGVTFHDGTPFDGEAVAFNIRRTIDPATNAPRSPDMGDVASVEVPDSHTVRVRLKGPSGAAISAFAVEAGMMCSPTALKKFGADFGRNPVGTGVFRFGEWVSGSQVVMHRNESYWRDGADGKKLPYADGVTVRFIPNTAVKMIEVKAGNVHVVDGITPRDFAEVEANPALRLMPVPPGIAQWLTFNVTRPPFNDQRLRAAVNAAMDRNQLMRAITRGYGAVTPTFVPNSEWNFDGSLRAPTLDVARAKRLLAEAGHPNGFSATLSIIQRDPDTQLAQLIQAQLRNAGINLKIEILERQAWVPKVLDHQHEIAMGRVNVPRADPDQVFSPFFGRDASQNWSGINDPEVFDAVDAARRATDRAERKRLYAKAQQLLLDRDYYAWLFFREARHVVRRELQNLEIDSGGAWLLGTAWLQPKPV
ncbi:ABC transporter substrate-binding protein [Roseomonas sp. OT10]|uniref:ABC transporter substrate-binding protein n=1 Tax=Roseomonas cutis TaxID=2897332 RepID=UPI001E327437|nr:ABC transporter substrate-binding protein [Roseomonas sp. OT10]UFN48368.1 ABC transporter substrate-binding protein [Roseomonas sp. OT10]